MSIYFLQHLTVLLWPKLNTIVLRLFLEAGTYGSNKFIKIEYINIM